MALPKVAANRERIITRIGPSEILPYIEEQGLRRLYHNEVVNSRRLERRRCRHELENHDLPSRSKRQSHRSFPKIVTPRWRHQCFRRSARTKELPAVRYSPAGEAYWDSGKASTTGGITACSIAARSRPGLARAGDCFMALLGQTTCRIETDPRRDFKNHARR